MSPSKIKNNYSEKVWKKELVRSKKKNILYLSDFFIDSEINKYSNLNKHTFKIREEIPRQYIFPDTSELISMIKKFHIAQGLPKSSFKVFETEGSTPMITTIILFARELGFKKIYSISPLYFNIHRICNALDMKIIPCNNDLTYEEGYSLKLPEKKSFLFITDPIWAIGRHHSKSLLEKLRKWQDKTKSLIFVDSSFDYTDWPGTQNSNLIKILNKCYTFRLICPTKVLGLHGVRFSYLLCPNKYFDELNTLSYSSIGPTGYFYKNLRKKIFKKMISSKTSPIATLASKRYNLIKKVLIEKDIPFIIPNCGVYLFAKIVPSIRKNKYYFWLHQIGVDIPFKKYSKYTKINLVMKRSKFNKLLNDLKK